MRMDDDGMDIIERYAPLFLAIEGDNQKSAIRGQMQTIPGNIDDPVHGQPFVSKSWQNMDNFWLTRSRIEDTAKFVDTNLTGRSEEHTSELQSLMRISYAVFCLKKKKKKLDRRSVMKN